jgi:hypothetical protein
MLQKLVFEGRECEDILESYELFFLIESTYERYAYSVFKIIRAMEISQNYAPMQRERKKAFKELCAVLVSVDFAVQVLHYHVTAEKLRRISNKARTSEQFRNAVQSLRRYGRTPLIAELPENIAYTLWNIGGSWAGALLLAKLEPLDKNEHWAAVRRYAVINARAELLPEHILRKFDKECAAYLTDLLDEIRRTGKLPPEEVFWKKNRMFKARKLKLYTCLEELGLNLAVKIPKPDFQLYQKQVKRLQQKNRDNDRKQ